MATNKSRTRSEKSDSSLCCLTGHAETEYFWCTELNANTKSVTWIINSEDTEDEEDDDFINHILIAKMAVLHANAVAGEQNIVELHSGSQDGEMQKGTIANLTRGLNPMTLLNYTIQGKVGCTFTLTEGSGPVIISGNHLLEFPRDDDQLMDASQCTEPEKVVEVAGGDDDDDDDDDEDDDDDDDEDDSDEKGKGKKSIKRKAPSKANKQKKPKIEENDSDENEDEEEEEDEDDDDDDDDDDEFEEVKTKQAKKVKDTGKKTKAKAQMEKDSGKKVAKKMKK